MYRGQKLGRVKGQLMSKGRFGNLNFSKKLKKKLDLTTMIS